MDQQEQDAAEGETLDQQLPQRPQTVPTNARPPVPSSATSNNPKTRRTSAVTRKRNDDTFFNTMGLDLRLESSSIAASTAVGGVSATQGRVDEEGLEEEDEKDASIKTKGRSKDPGSTFSRPGSGATVGSEAFFTSGDDGGASIIPRATGSITSRGSAPTTTLLQMVAYPSSTADSDAELLPENSGQLLKRELTQSRMEQLIIEYGTDANATVSAKFLDTPPPFGASDLADIIDGVMGRVAAEMGVSVQEVAGAHLPGASTRNAITVPHGGLTPAQMYLKIKTVSYANAEMGKKLERANHCISDLTGKLATAEGEKLMSSMMIDKLKKDLAAAEFRAKTAEAAVNAYNTMLEESKKKIQTASEAAGTFENSPNIVSLTLCGKTKGKKTRFHQDHERGDASSDGDLKTDSEMEFDRNEDPTRITRRVLRDTSKMLAAKKNFDPPTALSVGLNSCLDKEDKLCNQKTPMNPNARLPDKQLVSASSFRRSNKVSRLVHVAADHVNHLSNVLSAQTQQLLASRTPSEYLKTLHSQLEGMTHALHECIDALAEERRLRDKWRGKWEKASWQLKRELEQRRRETEGRESGRFRDGYLVNGLEPVAWSRAGVDVLESFLATQQIYGGSAPGAASDAAMAQRRRLVKTAPETSVRRARANEFDESVLLQCEIEEDGLRSKSACNTNRPKYKSESAVPIDANARFLLKQKLSKSDRDYQADYVPRIPTARTEIEVDYSVDKRLVDSAQSSAKSPPSTLDRTLVRMRPKKINYTIPSVSSVQPFENPLIKKTMRKKSPASAIKTHWATSDKI
ncbi:hypothetical protein HDU78_009145 [Chytriomyces hyalinus]|nr:hypothetical protein HDU78_009145 [Chytriomyces hyalinus]KAJ3262122.1 hypothetical protein HDU77_000480 [Chytriomyces hyalinus]